MNQDAANELEAFLKDAPLSSIVAIATCGSVTKYLSTETRRVLSTVGSYLIHSFNSSSMSWALVGLKGAAPAMAYEKLESGSSEVTATLPLQSKEISCATITAQSAGCIAGNTAQVVVDA